MFVKAIESVSGAVRPMHIIRQRFGDSSVLPDIASLFFVNENGYAVTSKRIATILKASSAVEQQYQAYLNQNLFAFVNLPLFVKRLKCPPN